MIHYIRHANCNPPAWYASRDKIRIREVDAVQNGSLNTMNPSAALRIVAKIKCGRFEIHDNSGIHNSNCTVAQF